MAPSRTARTTPWWVRLSLVGASLLVALLASEWVLRQRIQRASAYYVWEPSFERVFHPDPELLAGITGPSRFITNAAGLRGDELPGDADYRVLFVGGSTTECGLLDQEESWPHLVQTRLAAHPAGVRVWVGNAGSSGRHCRDHVVQLERLLPQLPAVYAVVMLVGVNDLCLVLAQGEDYDPRWTERPEAEQETLLRAFQLLPLDVEERFVWYKRTALWRFATELRDRYAPSPLVVDGAGASVERWREHRRGAPRLIDELPDLEPALGEYRRNVGRMIDLVQAAGARPILVTQPALWRPDLEPELERLCWMGGVGDYQAQPGCDYYSVAALASGMDAYNRVLLEVAGERGIECLDLAPAVPRDASAFYDDVHFNEAGARIVAEIVAGAIASRAPFR